MMTTLRQKWIKEFIQQIRELRGQQKQARYMILRLYARKFGAAPEKVVDFIQSITDLEKLDELDDQLMMAETAEELHSLWQLS